MQFSYAVWMVNKQNDLDIVFIPENTKLAESTCSSGC